MKVLLQMLAVVALTSLLSFGGLSLWRHMQAPAAGASGAEAGVMAEEQGTMAAMALVKAKGCPVCHTIDGTDGLGPTWRGVWGQVREFNDGSSALFDAAYLRESVASPELHVLTGFQNIMLPVELNDMELQQLEHLFRELGRTDVY